VLVFADRPVEATLERRDAATWTLRLAHAALHESAPRRLALPPQEPLEAVELEEQLAATGPEVLVTLRGRAPLPPPSLSSRGAVLAVELHGSDAEPARGARLDFREAELARVVESIAGTTGETFLFDERLRGRITLTSPTRVTPREARLLLDAALEIAGFAAVPTPGGAWRILPAEGAAGAAPFRPAGATNDSEAPVTTLVRLASASAEEALASLRPWLAGALALAHAPGNAILIAGSERRLHGLVGLLRALDRAAEEPLWVQRLRHRPAAEVARWLRESATGRVQVWADARSNALLVRAARADLPGLRDRVRRLDRPDAASGSLRVFRVRHVEAELLADHLRATAQGSAREGTLRATAPLAQLPLSVAVDEPTNSLVVAGAPETQRAVAELLAELDRPRRRLSVEAIVLEIDSDESLELGVDAFVPLTSPRAPGDLVASILLDPTGGGLPQPGAGAGPAGLARYTRAPLRIPIVDENGNPVQLLVPRETAVVTADGRELRSRVLMRPHLQMVSGEEQEIFAGDNIPVPVAADGGSPLEVRQSVERRDVGVRLRVRPTLGEAGPALLELDLDVTRVAPSILSRGAGPILQQRRLRSTIRLGDGEYAVVGVGRFPTLEEQRTGTPGLADAPGVGALFRATSERRRETRLIVAVGVRIHRDDAELAADTIRRTLGFARSLERAEPLARDSDAPWAVLAATHADAAGANDLANALEREGLPARVVAWRFEGRPRFDVYAHGFVSLAEASSAAARLAERGLFPELVPLPVAPR
jgi:general secretion pathway protein D